jgi:hypothetical protein
MRGYRRTWAVCGCLLALAALEGCSGPDRQPASRAGALNPRTDGRITLQVELPRDTIARGDRSAVQFFYYVVNGPEPVRFSNQPGNWQIRLETQDGTAVPGTFVTSGATGWLDAHVVLPARAIFGQVGGRLRRMTRMSSKTRRPSPAGVRTRPASEWPTRPRWS